ncbi:MAG: hypothetical protein V7706_17710 [Dietzia psychralcaliphila]
MPTCTQAHVEHLTRQALAAHGGPAVPADTVSDAVDLYLGIIERDTSSAIDRAAIHPQDAAHAVDAAVTCIRSRHTDEHI